MKKIKQIEQFVNNPINKDEIFDEIDKEVNSC